MIAPYRQVEFVLEKITLCNRFLIRTVEVYLLVKEKI